MFSTNDGENRRVRIWIDGPEGERMLDVANNLQAAGVAAYPTERRLRALATKAGTFQRSKGVELSRVRAAVWRTDFDAQTLEPQPIVIREATVYFTVPAPTP